MAGPQSRVQTSRCVSFKSDWQVIGATTIEEYRKYIEKDKVHLQSMFPIANHVEVRLNMLFLHE